MGEVTVGIDIGTTSVKGIVADEAGNVLARTRLPHRLHAPSPDCFEHDATESWWENVRAVWREMASGRDVLGVAVAAMVPSLCAVDDQGAPISPGLLYGDARGRLGDHPDQGDFGGFLQSLAATHPQAAGFWPAQAVANAALSGRGAIDTQTAMTATPVFSDGEWDAELSAGLGADVSQLPDLVPGLEAVGSVDGALLSGGAIDAFAEQIVAGACEVGDVLVICGTTLITWVVTDGWPEVDGLWTVPHSEPGKTLIGGASNAGGLFLDRIRRLTAPVTPDDTALLDSGDLPIWLPYLRGERTPLHDPGRRASLLDLHIGHGPAAIVQAAYEASGFVARRHVELAGVKAQRIVAVGGGTRVQPWMQALADVTGLPVDVSAVPEGAALGAAYMARVTAGLEADISDAKRWARTDRRVSPRPGWVGAVDARYRRFREVG